MNTCLKAATLALAAAAGLTAAPTRAADGTLGRDTDVVTLGGAERWSLRPTTMAAAADLAQRRSRAIPLSDLPDERRTVRIVYEGYGEPGSISAAR